jgi:hypothetical protein
MQADTAAQAPAKRQARSNISNGSAYLPSGDGRSIWARLARDTFAALVSLARLPNASRIAVL